MARRVRREGLRGWIRAYAVFWYLLVSGLFLGFGVSYIALGHLAGKLVGAVLITLALVFLVRGVIRPLARRSRRPSS